MSETVLYPVQQYELILDMTCNIHEQSNKKGGGTALRTRVSI